ncbi:hypothetical protein SCH4B_3648 [Ruegeria sp. TrichCH4B]|nr:hypothetical protein SCH4B_3648 [Ruegeria sp. TrichCH4B]
MGGSSPEQEAPKNHSSFRFLAPFALELGPDTLSRLSNLFQGFHDNCLT